MSRRRAARTFLRFAIGLVLLVTAAGKLLDIPGFAGVLGTYQALPEAALYPVALGVALAELALAIWLFTGIALPTAAAASVVLHFLYAFWSAVSVLRGLKLSNCGCFGVFWPRPLGWSTVAEDLVLTAASFYLAVLSRREGSFAGRRLA